MIPDYCKDSCEYIGTIVEQLKHIHFEPGFLRGLKVWIGSSKNDPTSIRINNLFSCVLNKFGVELLEGDFQAILDGEVAFDALIFFSFTPGVSARAIELIVSDKNNIKHIGRHGLKDKYDLKEKLHVFLPGEFGEGYIGRRLGRYLTAGKLIKRDYIKFEELDVEVLKKCIGHLTDIVSERKEYMETIFEPRVLIITALSKEFVMMRHLLDSQRIDKGLGECRQHFSHGKIGNIDVVVALSGVGNNASAAIATKAFDRYPTIDYVFITGIAGGIPSLDKPEEHVRLGDIVVCNDKGVIQHDMGKNVVESWGGKLGKLLNLKKSVFEHHNPPRAPDSILLKNVTLLVENNGPNEFKYWKYLDRLIKERNVIKPDVVDYADSPWIQGVAHEEHALSTEYSQDRPRIHFSPIACGNTVVKDKKVRDILKNRFSVKAIEMEASGVADAAWLQGKNIFIVRGICDYSNQEKNKKWQQYAAAVAASFTKEVIEQLSD